jgi:hypothetical protein
MKVLVLTSLKIEARALSDKFNEEKYLKFERKKKWLIQKEDIPNQEKINAGHIRKFQCHS